MFGRIAKALETIARELHDLNTEIRDMRKEQKEFMERTQREAANAPDRIREVFSQVKTLMGGGH
jgi:predicted  nucleic acid-binding Zn-ribbon protein